MGEVFSSQKEKKEPNKTNTKPPRRSLNIPLADAGESHRSRKIREANRRILSARNRKKHMARH